MDESKSPKLRRIEQDVERKIRELGEAGELEGLPGEGAPLREDDAGPSETWAARHILQTSKTAPEWAELRKEIDERVARVRRRAAAHRQWLHDRTLLLAELPADRIVDAVKATSARDARVQGELVQAVSEVNALIRRYDLLVVPALQLPLITLDRLADESR